MPRSISPSGPKSQAHSDRVCQHATSMYHVPCTTYVLHLKLIKAIYLKSPLLDGLIDINEFSIRFSHMHGARFLPWRALVLQAGVAFWARRHGLAAST